MEGTQFERPEYFGISEEERERAVKTAGLPENTTREELTEDYYESWLAEKGAEYSRGKSREELTAKFAEFWANPDNRKSQYESRITEKISAAHAKNKPEEQSAVATPDIQTPETKTEKDEEVETPHEEASIRGDYTRAGTLGEPREGASAVPPWADEAPVAKKPAAQRSEKNVTEPTPETKPTQIEEIPETPQKAIELAKELNIKLPEGDQKPGAEWFEIKKEIANRLGIEDVTSFSIDSFVDVPAKWINDLIRKNNGESVKYESDKQRIWTNKTMEKIYLSKLPTSEKKEKKVEGESEKSENAGKPKNQEGETTQSENETESETKKETEITTPEEEETLTINFDQYIEEIRSTLADGKQKKTTIELPSNDLDLINAFKKKLKQEGFIYGDTRMEPGKKSATIKGIQRIKSSK